MRGTASSGGSRRGVDAFSTALNVLGPAEGLRFASARDNGDIGARGCKPRGNGEPDPFASAGDHRDAVHAGTPARCVDGWQWQRYI